MNGSFRSTVAVLSTSFLDDCRVSITKYCLHHSVVVDQRDDSIKISRVDKERSLKLDNVVKALVLDAMACQ